MSETSPIFKTMLDDLLPWADPENPGVTVELDRIEGNDAWLAVLEDPPDELRGPKAGEIHYTFNSEDEFLEIDYFVFGKLRNQGIGSRYIEYSVESVLNHVKGCRVESRVPEIQHILVDKFKWKRIGEDRMEVKRRKRRKKKA